MTDAHPRPAGAPSLLLIEADPLCAERFVDRVVIGLPGVSVHVAPSLQEAFERLDRGGTDLAVLDLGGGLDLPAVEELLGRDDAPATIVMAGQDDDGLALKAIRLGAQDFLTRRDATPEVLARAIRYALERKQSQTRLLQAEATSRENLELFRIISKNGGDLVALVSPDGARIYENYAYARALGYTMEELKNHSPLDLLHPEDRDRIRATLKDLFLRGTEATFQYGMQHKDGSWHQFEGRAAPVRGAARGPELAIIVARDITERLRMDTEILRSHAVKNLILENSTLGIAYVANRKFEWANTRWGEILGRPMHEVLGASTRIAYPDDASFEEMGRAIYPPMQRWEGSERVWQLCKGDGSLFWCRMIGRPLDPEQPNQGSVWIMEDTTDRVNAEQERLSLEVQLRHAQKLEAIGQLAAGIAHEINTPTQYIGDNTKFLAEGFRDLIRLMDAQEEALKAGPLPEALRDLRVELDMDYLREEIPKALDQSLEGIARVTRIVKAMKDFSHPGSDHPMEVDLNQAIESTLTVSRNEWKYVADLELDLDPALPPVLCYANEVNQAMLNLVVNAAHAIEDAQAGNGGAKGILRITTTHAEGQVEIRIQDSGTGIPEHVRGRIFDPFFTTKPVGKGTGQGLAIVHTVVVERHKGSVAFETELGKGSVFILRFPVSSL